VAFATTNRTQLLDFGSGGFETRPYMAHAQDMGRMASVIRR
jgi:hypothetical protein